MKMDLLKAMFAAVMFTLVSFAGAASMHAQDSPQKEVASKKARFESVAKTDALYTGALDAHDKAAAEKMIGKDGAIKGKVTKIFTPRGGSILILNFDRDYKTALTAVLKKGDFSKFPDMTQLEGKEIVVSGKFIEFKDNPEIALNDPKQIAIVK